MGNDAEETLRMARSHQSTQVVPPIKLARPDAKQNPRFIALKAIRGPAEGRIYPLHERNCYVIGRKDADLVVPDTSISRRHCQVVWRDDGTPWLEDLASANGTLLNEQPATKSALHIGDEIKLGESVLKVVAHTPEVTPTEAIVSPGVAQSPTPSKPGVPEAKSTRKLAPLPESTFTPAVVSSAFADLRKMLRDLEEGTVKAHGKVNLLERAAASALDDAQAARARVNLLEKESELLGEELRSVKGRLTAVEASLRGDPATVNKELIALTEQVEKHKAASRRHHTDALTALERIRELEDEVRRLKAAK